MSFYYPALKPAVEVHENPGHANLFYRGQQLAFINEEAHRFFLLRPHLNGCSSPQALASCLDIDLPEIEWLLAQLESAHMLIDAGAFASSPGQINSEYAFWLLEADLCRFKFSLNNPIMAFDLESMIARGEVRQEVAEGYLIELGYLLRQVPQELALAVASASNEKVRSLYVKFFQEECEHGQMIFDQLKTWIDPQKLYAMHPLPGTVAVLNMYKVLANESSLAYAVALMRDESTPLDPPIRDASDPYSGLKKHYTVPKEVVSIFEWHAHLDRECDHGFFPLEVFRCFDFLTNVAVDQLRMKMITVFETHAMWRRNLFNYYSKNSIFDRITPSSI